jgi:hypothetical protein
MSKYISKIYTKIQLTIWKGGSIYVPTVPKSMLLSAFYVTLFSSMSKDIYLSYLWHYLPIKTKCYNSQLEQICMDSFTMPFVWT